MDASEFLDVFAAEARDYLQALSQDLLALENNPDDRSILDEMFRAAHSLKGMSGTMGFNELADFTHQMESVLDLLRTGEIQANQQITNVLFESLDNLEILLNKTLLEEDIDDISHMVKPLEDILNAKDQFAAKSAPKADSALESNQEPVAVSSGLTITLDDAIKETVEQGFNQGFNAYEVQVKLRQKTLLKSVRVFTIFNALEEYGTIIKSQPPAQDLEEERFGLEFAVVYLTTEDLESIQKLVEGISEVESVVVKEIKLNGRTKVTEVKPVKAETKTQKIAQPKKNDTSVVNKGVFADRFVRVATDRLDNLINLVGELVISRTQVLEIGQTINHNEAKSTFEQLDRITTDLQYAAMKLRMVPVKQVFDRFPRMVRDLAQASNKSIQLEIYGEDTELDRSLVNQIADPLVHLIRNSIDHGIETKEVREALGKPAQGLIRLEARHEGSHVIIEVADDGQGINVEKIKEKAINKGLLPENFTGELSTAEAIELLFKPGFSTSEKITDISGRGVGMDAVKTAVEALSGQVIMTSTPGKGSSIVIKLPLTLAIIKALLVRTHGQIYAIPIQAVRENLLITKDQIKTVNREKVFVLRNEVLPLFDLAETLGFESQDDGDSYSVIVTEDHGGKVGFIVDELIGQQEIVIKSLNELVGDIPGIGGATVLGSGRVALILDHSTLIKRRSETIG